MGLSIRPLNTGFVTTLPKQYMYHHSTVPYLRNVPDARIEMPCFAFLIEGLDRPMLVDTGMAWTDRASRYHHPGSSQPDGFSIVDQLHSIGIEAEDVGTIVFTHLHWDHMYYMERFSQAQYWVNEKEYAFALNPIPLYYKSYEHPVLGLTRPFEGLTFQLTKGDQEIFQGVRVFEAFGHSPGHQCVEVDTREGTYIICGDAVFTLDNFREIPEIHYNITPPGRYANIIESWHTIESIKQRAQSLSFVLPCHETTLLSRVAETPVLGR